MTTWENVVSTHWQEFQAGETWVMWEREFSKTHSQLLLFEEGNMDNVLVLVLDEEDVQVKLNEIDVKITQCGNLSILA